MGFVVHCGAPENSPNNVVRTRKVLFCRLERWNIRVGVPLLRCVHAESNARLSLRALPSFAAATIMRHDSGDGHSSGFPDVKVNEHASLYGQA